MCGAGIGSIDLGIIGDCGPYTYLWSNGETTEDITGLAAGTYTCTITDANGCSVTSESTLSGSVPIVIDAVTRIDDNCGAAEGSINLTVSGGTAPLTYAWSNGANTEDITALIAGTYICTITDANGCTIESTTTLVDQAITVTNVITINDICGANTGSIDLTVTGDGGPFIYAWSNGATAQDINNLSAGTYTCTITDINGCIVESITTITGAAVAIDNAITINDDCGDGSGSIDLFVSGGTAPFTYNWSNGATSGNGNIY